MRITVLGVLIMVGTIVALALIADKLIAATINKQRRTDNDQPSPNS